MGVYLTPSTVHTCLLELSPQYRQLDADQARQVTAAITRLVDQAAPANVHAYLTDLLATRDPASFLPSSEYQVTYHEGTRDVLDACRARLDAHAATLDEATDVNDLIDRQRDHIAMLDSFLYGLLRITRSNDHDGPAHLYPDPAHPLSLGFRYQRSGYTDGFVFWPSHDQGGNTGADADGDAGGSAGGRWQIHT